MNFENGGNEVGASPGFAYWGVKQKDGEGHSAKNHRKSSLSTSRVANFRWCARTIASTANGALKKLKVALIVSRNPKLWILVGIIYHDSWIVTSLTSNGVRKEGGFGVNPPPWVWYIIKTLLPAQIIFAYFLLVTVSTQCKHHGMNLNANFKEHCIWAKK